MAKPTNKNMQVYRFYKANGGEYKNYKAVYDENRTEIEAKFGIKTYAGFRQHCAKVFTAIQNNLIEWKG